MTKFVSQHPETDIPDHAEFQYVYEHSSIGTLAVDTGGIIRFVNTVELAYMGLTKQDIIDRPLFSFYNDTSQVSSVKRSS